MRLSWNEIRSRAAAFAAEWEGQGYEKGQTQLFYQAFFAVFGMPIRRVATFEEPVKTLGEKRGFIDLFWKGVLLVEQKSVGRSLVKAKKQAFEYFPGLKDSELPRYLLLSDFQTFELYDLDEGWEATIRLADLPRHVEKFAFILGIQRRTFRDQDPVNIEAAELMGTLHDVMKESGYAAHDLERLLVRLVFCLFADDTGIFEPRGGFQDLIEQRTSPDGSDTGLWLEQLFQVLNTPESQRQRALDEDLAGFPYINGELFAERLRIPAFNAAMRVSLIQACRFNWEAISPAIFGSLFQSVLDKKERRAHGAHYTTEKNILKVIEPLFLDDLRTELERLKARNVSRRKAELRRFQEKLSTLKFFDPACGCGNFLVIAYREIRRLEHEALHALFAAERGRRGEFTAEIDVSQQSRVNVDQFYGIELDEFAARIAETALWMMDHIMNNRLSLEMGRYFNRIPIRESPHIVNCDALELDWESLLPARECSFVLGNPPFVGAKYQSEEQRAQVRRIAELGGSGGTLDYVAAWFITASRYIQSANASVGFVATNSITQGEQVAQLWPAVLDRHGLEIAFAHQTFVWGSDAPRKAHVHVVIIGLARAAEAPRRRQMFSYIEGDSEPHQSLHAAITPYLFDGGNLTNNHLVVRETSRPLNGLQRMVIGSKPIDGGHYIFKDRERQEFLREEPGAADLLHPYVGSKEFINGGDRWILFLERVAPETLTRLPKVRERIAAVREYRLGRASKPTQALAQTPASYHVTVVPDAPFLVIPKVSSERRDYVPIGWLEPPTVPSDLVFVLKDATKPLFALLTSAMHMSWLRHIGGRLKSDYRYSIGLVYNTFPLPQRGNLDKLEAHAQAVLDARAAHPGASLADLYDPDSMPTNLRRAHRDLDRAVDRLYRRAAFASDRERVEHLFVLYEKTLAPIAALAAPKKRKHR